MANDIAFWYEKYGPMVTRRCRTLLHDEDEVKDAVQDVFLNLLKAEGRRFYFPSSLLYTIATNVCLNRLRAKKTENRIPLDDFLFDGAEHFSANDSSYEQVDAELLVQTLLEDESEETRDICFMYYFDGMNLREIGEATGMSVSGVQKRLETFKKRTRLKLEDKR